MISIQEVLQCTSTLREMTIQDNDESCKIINIQALLPRTSSLMLSFLSPSSSCAIEPRNSPESTYVFIRTPVTLAFKMKSSIAAQQQRQSMKYLGLLLGQGIHMSVRSVRWYKFKTHCSNTKQCSSQMWSLGCRLFYMLLCHLTSRFTRFRIGTPDLLPCVDTWAQWQSWGTHALFQKHIYA